MSTWTSLKPSFWRWALGLSLLVGGGEEMSMAAGHDSQKVKQPAVGKTIKGKPEVSKQRSRSVRKSSPSRRPRRSGEGRGQGTAVPLGGVLRFVVDGCEAGQMTLVPVKEGLPVILSARLLPEGCLEGATVALRVWRGWSTKPLPVEGKRTRLEVVSVEAERVVTRTRTRFFSLPLKLFRRAPREALKVQLSVTLERGPELEGVLALRGKLTSVGGGAHTGLDGEREPLSVLSGPPLVRSKRAFFPPPLPPVPPGQWRVIEL